MSKNGFGGSDVFGSISIGEALAALAKANTSLKPTRLETEAFIRAGGCGPNRHLIQCSYKLQVQLEASHGSSGITSSAHLKTPMTYQCVICGKILNPTKQK